MKTISKYNKQLNPVRYGMLYNWNYVCRCYYYTLIVAGFSSCHTIIKKDAILEFSLRADRQNLLWILMCLV